MPTTNPLQQTHSAAKPRWKDVERIAKIFSLVVIPIILGAGTVFLQRSLAQGAASREYTNLAFSILREPLPKEPQAHQLLLRDLAVDLLKTNLPVRLSPATEAALRSGSIILPKPEGYPAADGYVTVSHSVAEVGTPVTFTAHGRGGNGEYIFTWVGDEGVTGEDYSVTAAFRTPGEKTVSVRITSNGEFVYCGGKVRIIEKKSP
jgi:hypothetical protein